MKLTSNEQVGSSKYNPHARACMSSVAEHPAPELCKAASKVRGGVQGEAVLRERHLGRPCDSHGRLEMRQPASAFLTTLPALVLGLDAVRAGESAISSIASRR